MCIGARDPAFGVDEVSVVLADPYRRLAGVRLVQDLGISADLRFTRERTHWSLRFPRPAVDRMEYLLELADHKGRRWTITDPDNANRAPGAFGAKSVLEFPGYETPSWLDAVPVVGIQTPLDIDAPRLNAVVTGSIWSPADLEDGQSAPLLVVHDGPEFASLGGFTHYLASSIALGTLPPVRAALLQPGERDKWYSANPDYAETLISVVLPALPAATLRIGVGVSLGALAMLHAQHMHSAFDALFLQSGSFFCPDLDAQESGFTGFAAVTGFVASMHAGPAAPHPVPTALTCGSGEENLANNARMASALRRLGFPAGLTTIRDAHNFTAWRDALHPSLTDLMTALVASHAA